MTVLLNKTQFPKNENHCPKIFVVNAKNKILGRLATLIANYLIGKEDSFSAPGSDQGNFVIVTNTKYINVSGNKNFEKFYYRNSQRPGSLKKESFNVLKDRLPARILENAVKRMLPKGVLGRTYYKRLFIYSENEFVYKNFINEKPLIQNIITI